MFCFHRWDKAEKIGETAVYDEFSDRRPAYHKLTYEQTCSRCGVLRVKTFKI